MQQHKIIEHLATVGTPILHIKAGQFKTNTLARFGIYVCNDCGQLQPMELTHCKNCGEVRLMGFEEKNEQIVNAAQKQQEINQLISMRQLVTNAHGKLPKPKALISYITEQKQGGKSLLQISQMLCTTESSIQRWINQKQPA